MAAFSGYIPALLRALKAPNTPQNRLFLQLWQRAEGGSAENNPFNTTEPARGASNYNGVGVKNYGSPAQGLTATIRTLENGRYGSIVRDLRSGHATAKQLGVDLTNSPWGTGSGVLRLLGDSSTPSVRSSGKQAPAGNALLSSSPDAMKQLLSSYFFQQAEDALSGQQPDSGGIMQLALARQAISALQPSVMPHVAGPQAHPNDGAAPMTTGGRSPYSNLRFNAGVDWQHVNPTLLQRVNRAAMAHGVVVDINSGYRSNQHSEAVGGFAGDPHTRGIAIDAYVNGRPIGDVIPPSVWRKLGITSGDVPNFYNGSPDPEHLQL